MAARGIQVPASDNQAPAGVVHLGLGAFHRAHQALVFGSLLDGDDPRWGVLGVSMRNPALADVLASQQGLYSVQIASASGRSWHIGGAIRTTCLATRDRAAVVQALAAPTTRWVTLTVTEKGYVPALADLLVEGLAVRQADGLAGLTLASCDNLQNNGRTLQALCAASAARHSPALADWVSTRCAFPNSMVDRIVPAGSPAIAAQAREALGLPDAAALRTEAFWEWVIERSFADPADASALQAAGVQVVDDVGPYEEAKLRLLNGSHSVIACIGAVAGIPVVSECVARPEVRTLVHGLMSHDIGPMLRRKDWSAYRDALLVRFANPYLQHGVHQIATDSSLKIALRWVPAAVDALATGRTVPGLAYCAAAWMRYCEGVDESGRAYALSDPRGDTLRALAQAHRDDASATFDALGTLPDLWGDTLPHHAGWRHEVTTHLQALRRQGVLARADHVARTLAGLA
jgi:fructuronate reductase